jgi:hypothetical protein
MRAATLVSLVLTLAAPACAQVKGGAGAAPGDAAADPGVTPNDAGQPDIADAGPRAPFEAAPEVGPTITFIVYAHTSDRLYAVDPEAQTVRLVGPFMRINELTGTLGPLNGVTDIAVDHSGHINGLTSAQVLRIDERTAECTTLATIDGSRQLNGLSWVTVPGGEVLMATAGDGSVFRLDPMTGQSTRVGTLGAGLISSGDLVSVAKFGTLVTVKRSLMVGDWLAKLDPATGAATLIGAIGFNNVWGIGFWKDRVFGFDLDGHFILIDPSTGAGTLSQAFPDLHWWGAGVSTSVFVIP